jgi:hypothetical protein
MIFRPGGAALPEKPDTALEMLDLEILKAQHAAKHA